MRVSFRATAFAAPIILLAAANAQSQRSFFREVFPHPTGANGYEEYLRAADLVNDGLLDSYLDGIVRSSPSPALMTRQESISHDFAAMDYLAQRKAVVSRYGKALDFVAQGSTKELFDPRELDARRPELRSFWHLLRLAAAKGYVQFAEGEAAGGVRTLLDALTFSRRIAPINSLANLYGIAGSQDVLDLFAETLPQLSLTDATTVQTYAAGALSEASPLILGMRQSEAVHDDLLLKAFKEPEKVLPELLQSDAKLRIERMSPAEIRQLGEAMRGVYHAMFQRIIRDLQGPEENWYGLSQQWSADNQPPKITEASSIEETAESLRNYLVPDYHRLVTTELRRRAQMRLLGLHAGIRAYWWHNHRLPTRLEEVGNANDALSGQPFVYEPSPKGGYRLYSRGRPETGPVELRYKSPVPMGVPEP